MVKRNLPESAAKNASAAATPTVTTASLEAKGTAPTVSDSSDWLRRSRQERNVALHQT